jgi:hypothetical protein
LWGDDGLKIDTFQSPDGLALAWYELGGGDGLPPIIMQHGFSSATMHEWVECGIADDVAIRAATGTPKSPMIRAAMAGS